MTCVHLDIACVASVSEEPGYEGEETLVTLLICDLHVKSSYCILRNGMIQTK